MDLYNKLENTHTEFFNHVYEDISFYLKDKHGKTRDDLLNYLKKKYTFYNFENDKFNLIKNVQNILVNKIVKSATSYYNYDKNYNKNDLRIIIKKGFYPFMNNESIFTFEVANAIDKKLYNINGKLWYDAYQDVNYIILESGLFTCNIRQ